MRQGLLAAAGAAALAVAGCGATPDSTAEFRGEERAVAEVVAELQESGERRRADDICSDLLTAELRERIPDCGKQVRKAIEDADRYELTVEDVTVTGDKATARVETRDAGRTISRTFELARVSGAWRIASFGR